MSPDNAKTVVSDVASDGSSPGRVRPVASTRVMVAFPFSSIRVDADTDACIELAGLVCELCELLEAAEGTPETAALADRARKLAADLAR